MNPSLRRSVQLQESIPSFLAHRGPRRWTQGPQKGFKETFYILGIGNVSFCLIQRPPCGSPFLSPRFFVSFAQQHYRTYKCATQQTLNSNPFAGYIITLKELALRNNCLDQPSSFNTSSLSSRVSSSPYSVFTSFAWRPCSFRYREKTD